VVGSGAVLRLNFCAKNPPLRQAANRYGHFRKKEDRQMKLKTYIFIGLTILILTACGQGKIQNPIHTIDKFEEFKAKEKIVEDTTIFYPELQIRYETF
jgi:hypothetical protein